MESRFPADNRATIQDRLEDEDGLRRRLESDPSDPVAGDLLEALYRRRGDHEQAVALLIDRAETAESPELKVGLEATMRDTGQKETFTVRFVPDTANASLYVPDKASDETAK